MCILQCKPLPCYTVDCECAIKSVHCTLCTVHCAVNGGKRCSAVCKRSGHFKVRRSLIRVLHPQPVTTPPRPHSSTNNSQKIFGFLILERENSEACFTLSDPHVSQAKVKHFIYLKRNRKCNHGGPTPLPSCTRN